jgi:hypothetical protein
LLDLALFRTFRDTQQLVSRHPPISQVIRILCDHLLDAASVALDMEHQSLEPGDLQGTRQREKRDRLTERYKERRERDD